MIEPAQFRVEVIRPTLRQAGLWSKAAEDLLLGTAVVESGLRFLRQHGRGPALGLYQIEPATHDDIWRHYLTFRPHLAAQVEAFLMRGLARHQQLVANLAYATAIARLVYYRRPAPLPEPGDVEAMARYWKANFNTRAGDGRTDDFVRKAGPIIRST